MHFQFIRPSKFLSQYIKHYWILEAEHSEGEICERVIPTGNIEWMFHFKKPFAIKGVNQMTYQPRSFVSGVNSNFIDVSTRGDSGAIAVTFYPHGASNFLQFPLSDIENTSVNLENIFHEKITEIEERISMSNSHTERIAIIEKFLVDCFKPVKENDLSIIKRGVELINQSVGQINVTELSGELLQTNKSLERKFSVFLGKTPKQFIRIVRFQGVIQSFSNLKNKHLTRLAYENGYFDQAHFVKDFKSLSGYTPKEFLALGACHSDYFE